MTKLDSITLDIPISFLTGYDDRMFITTGNMESGMIHNIQANKDLLKDYIGLNSIRMNSSSVMIDISAKVLHSDYLNGISKESIYTAIDNINNTGIISFKKKGFVRDSRVLKCDVTDNLKVSQDVRKYISALHLNHIRQIENVNYTDTKLNNGVVFRKTNLYTKCYNKHIELQRSDNKELLSQFPNLLNDSTGIARWETSLRTFEQIRNGFGIKELYLESILESDTKVNLNTFKNIIDTDMKPNNITFSKISDWHKYELMRSVLLANDLDLDKCRTYVKSKVPTVSSSNLSRELNTLQEYKKMIELNNDTTSSELLNELETELSK